MTGWWRPPWGRGRADVSGLVAPRRMQAYCTPSGRACQALPTRGLTGPSGRCRLRSYAAGGLCTLGPVPRPSSPVLRPSSLVRRGGPPGENDVFLKRTRTPRGAAVFHGGAPRGGRSPGRSPTEHRSARTGAPREAPAAVPREAGMLLAPCATVGGQGGAAPQAAPPAGGQPRATASARAARGQASDRVGGMAAGATGETRADRPSQGARGRGPGAPTP